MSGPSLQSVIAASVARTDRRTGDWRWHAPIISEPSAVFAITESLAEQTESDSRSLYSGAISTPTGCTASVDHRLTGPGLSINLKNCFRWTLDRTHESGPRFFKCLNQESLGSTQVTEAGKINNVVKKAAWQWQGLIWTAWRQSRKEKEGQAEHCHHLSLLFKVTWQASMWSNLTATRIEHCWSRGSKPPVRWP